MPTTSRVERRVLQGLSRFSCAGLVALVVASGVRPALAETSSPARSKCAPAVSTGQLFKGTVDGFKNMANGDTIGLLSAGAAASFGVHAVDGDVTRNFAGQRTFGDAFKAGAIVGGTPFELGASFAAYSLGRAFGKPCLATIGAELFQGQLMAETIAFGIKQAARRTRPDGTSFSFPSGHTTVSFASATVLQRHFGWKVGVPAYAVAAYVAASRVDMNRHYLSDVAFGAALGIAIGRSVPIGGGHRLMVTPLATPGGAGAGFTWVGGK